MEENITPIQPKKTTGKLRKFILSFSLAVVLLIVYFIICVPLYNSYMRNKPENSAKETALQEKNITLEEELLSASAEKNKELPAMVDASTEWTTTSASGKELTLYMKTTSDNIMTQSWVDEKLKKNKIDGLCNNSAFRDLLEKGVIIILEYHNKNGELGGIFTVNLLDCK